MRIYIGSDHAGFQLKNELKEYLESKNAGVEAFSLLDLGVFSADKADYPAIAREVCEKVRENTQEQVFGILICGSGVGMSIAANKLHGIRAVLANNTELAELSRLHNDANVLCLGGRMTELDAAKAITDKFLSTAFSGEERHVARITKIDQLGG